MKKLMCLLVVFLISNAANAADKWEYVHLTLIGQINGGGAGTFALFYPDGKYTNWTEKEPKPPKGFDEFIALRADVPIAIVLKRDFSQPINVVNALGLLGFEMVGNTLTDFGENFLSSWWFKRKISKLEIQRQNK